MVAAALLLATRSQLGRESKYEELVYSMITNSGKYKAALEQMWLPLLQARTSARQKELIFILCMAHGKAVALLFSRNRRQQ